MNRLIWYTINVLALVGLLMVAGYLKARRENESARWFWGYSENLLIVAGLLFLICAGAVLVTEVYWFIDRR